MSIEEVIIESDRLILRPLTRSDAPALARLGTGDVFELVPEIGAPFDATAWVESKLEREVPPICHVILLKETKELIGYCQIQFEVGENDYDLSAGLWFGRDHWCRGYATETMRALLSHLGSKGGRLRPLFAIVHPDNTASRRVFENCGFVLQGKVDDRDRSCIMLRYRWLQTPDYQRKDV